MVTRKELAEDPKIKIRSIFFSYDKLYLECTYMMMMMMMSGRVEGENYLAQILTMNTAKKMSSGRSRYLSTRTNVMLSISTRVVQFFYAYTYKIM